VTRDILRPAAAYDATDSILLYVRATAYLRSGKAQEAVHEFQGIRDLHSLHPRTRSFPSPLLAKPAVTYSWVTRQERALHIKISLPSGKTPTPTSLS
jgi:hypothetical protein